jgi:glucosamine--fructose-6-phosphate aminotransferase (isomerizing)
LRFDFALGGADPCRGGGWVAKPYGTFRHAAGGPPTPDEFGRTRESSDPGDHRPGLRLGDPVQSLRDRDGGRADSHAQHQGKEGLTELGGRLEREIREQPGVWRALAAADTAQRLALALRGHDVLLVGSGSSLFMAQLGALALRRRGISAQALAATEARLDHRAYAGWTVLAVSQSGRSRDVLDAIERIGPPRLIALTNSPDSPLAARAAETFDAGAGIEIAIPATKSVSACAVLLLWAASLLGGGTGRNAAVLTRTADAVERWIESGELERVRAAARRTASLRSAIVVGSDYGLPIASEAALKFKEAAYLHAEGFAAGEFRHGSRAMLDANCAIIGVIDGDGYAVVARPIQEAAASNAARFTIGSARIAGVEHLGPDVEVPFNTLAWLVTAQLLALFTARERGIDSDRPRGLTKALADASP